jgi:hypothetical protein
MEELASGITAARRIARRLERSRRYSRRSVAQLIDAVWDMTTKTQIVTASLATHLAGYKATSYESISYRPGFSRSRSNRRASSVRNAR